MMQLTAYFARTVAPTVCALTLLMSTNVAHAQAAADSTATAAPATATAPSDTLIGYEYRKVEQLINSKRWAAALSSANTYLQGNPRDPQMRLLKSRILHAQDKPTEALQLLQELTQEYPEIPEPHNNLAVLQAQAGNVEEARLSLETALRLKPNYSVAQENLGDIYVRMARNAYTHALSLNPGSAALRQKINKLP